MTSAKTDGLLPNIHAVHRDWVHQFPVMARAEGVYLWDESGKRYIDGSGGSSVVVTIGHGIDDIPRAMYEQAKRFSFYPAHMLTNRPMLELARLIVSLMPGGMRDRSKVWFCCTGTDATDDAIRLARQHFVEQGKPSKSIVITRWEAFHGNSLSAAGYSGHTFRRRIFNGMFADSPHIAPAFCYRCWFEDSCPGCGLKCATMLEKTIRQYGPENVAAFIAEPVVGASLAAAPAPEGYFQKVREICDKYDVLFIADEVMTGWGRTGKMFGIEHWGVEPDIIATAKGMSSGYTPLAAVIAKDAVWQPLIDNQSAFRAGHTLNANAVSCAGGIAVIRHLLEHDLVSAVAQQGAYFLEGLRTLLASRIVGDVRGLGLMAGFEIVKDGKTREPFALPVRAAARLQQIAFDKGLVIYACGGSVDGIEGDMILLAPPFIITREQIDETIAILKQSVEQLEHDIA